MRIFLMKLISSSAPGICIKRAVTLLVPLTDVTDGDEDQMVTVHTFEGPVTVRAGDFFLAKGVKGEIWPYPKDESRRNYETRQLIWRVS